MTRRTIEVSFVLVLIVLLASCEWGESSDSRYESHAEARDQGALGNWLPNWLPTAATNVREFHRVDQALSWIKYDAPSGQSVPIDPSCQVASEADIWSSVFEVVPPAWWPADLGRIDPAVAARWNLLACDDAYIAHSSKGDVESVYVWRTVR